MDNEFICETVITHILSVHNHHVISSAWRQSGGPDVETIMVGQKRNEARNAIVDAMRQAVSIEGQPLSQHRLWVDTLCVDTKNINDQDLHLHTVIDIYHRAKVLTCVLESHTDLLSGVRLINIVADECQKLRVEKLSSVKDQEDISWLQKYPFLCKAGDADRYWKKHGLPSQRLQL
ncbi:hypothetical protein F5Y18DRAFT_433635 [Xylariaceae sp. FL1019]|nr:hypothetical protein F5Y18DRAFT_433635 [Xylariaceae sp. FL1019]